MCIIVYAYKYDSEISMYYLNSRFYNPDVGRFINSDGLFGMPGELLSNNFYNYANNNPVMNVDCHGQAADKNKNLVSALERESVKTVTGKFLHVKWGFVEYRDGEVLSGDDSAMIDVYAMSNFSNDPSSALVPSVGIRVNLGKITLIRSFSLGGGYIGIGFRENYVGISTGFSLENINLYYNFSLEINGKFISFQTNLTMDLVVVGVVAVCCILVPVTLVAAGIGALFLLVFNGGNVE
ncbi:RHS repeat-associated core domain-containing protein [Mycoplasmatota bacterium WC30]